MRKQCATHDLGKGMLTDADVEAAMMAYLRDKEQADDAALREWLGWVEETRIRETLLRLVLKGKVTVEWRDTDLVFCLAREGEAS